tara:strand:+ start:11397 stop:12353 length:957 start_codon:yes stop_codon:yes gene_type:complete
MNIKSKIYIAGHTGMVGSAILRALEKKGYSNLLFRTHKELDLTCQQSVLSFFEREKPDVVFIGAAKVGGINSNNKYRADFLYNNLMIQNNLIHFSHKNNVKKLLFLGSSCIYPKFSEQPIKEEELLTGTLEPTNEPYAIAKIAGIKLCESYYRQYGDNFFSVMPTNLYGINDNFNLEHSHVIPALIRKIHEAKINKLKNITVWGDGSPMREFLNVFDLADACIYLVETANFKELYSSKISHLNVGSGLELTIKELVEILIKIIKYDGGIIFNKNMPNGTPRKLIDSSKLKKLGWESKIDLITGLSQTYNWYLKNLDGS